MSWQDELQQLDSALAAGQLSADEYRQRRDRVLAQASGQSPGEVSPPSEQGNASESTQFVRPVGTPGADGADRTQAVQSDRTQVVSGNPADKTQIVPNQAMNAQPGFPPPPPPAWETARPPMPMGQPMHGQQMQSPPWMNDDGLPPEFGSQSWPRQGPEIFADPGSGGNGKKIAIIAVVALLVIAGGVAAFLFLGGDNNQAEPTTPVQTTTAAPTSTGPKLPDGPFVELAGTEDDNQNLTIETAVKGKVPTESQAAFLEEEGVTAVGMYVTKDGPLVRAVWSFTPAEGTDPKVLLTALDKYFADAGHKEMTGLPTGVLGRSREPANDKERSSFRGFYIADDVVVQIESYGPDETAAGDAFAEILQNQTAQFPPTT